MKFPNELLAYLEVAVTRPLGPGAVSHRAVYYRVTHTEHGRSRSEYLAGAACQPTTTRPTGTVDRNGEPVQETVPVTVCTSMSASWAQSHGATRCTDPACYPLPETPQPPPAAPKRATKRATKAATKTAAKPAKKATTGGTRRRQGGAS
jgi:hypothetical protein